MLTLRRAAVLLLFALCIALLTGCIGEPALPGSGQGPLPTAPPQLSATLTPAATAATPTLAAVGTVAATSPTAPAIPTSTTPPTAPPTATAANTATPADTTTSTPVPATPTPLDTITSTPVPLTPTPQPTPQRVTLLASGFGSPDDLAVDPRDGTIYFGDFGNGAINKLDPSGGTAVVVAGGFKEPEGIAVTADGLLIVVEQATNRLWRVDPQDGSKTLLRQLQNNTGQDGVDGIAIDPTNNTLLVPDSPNNRLLRMNLDGSGMQVIARGLVRPTGVAVLADGDLLVTEEFGNVLDRVTTDGNITSLSQMFQPDDVVVNSQGSAYANSLGGNIYRVDTASGKRTMLLDGLNLPHGLAIDPQGNLIVVDSGHNRILRVRLDAP